MSYEALLAPRHDARRRSTGGGQDKYTKRTAAAARERIVRLLDSDTFIESGLFGSSGAPEQAEETQTDGKIAGFGSRRPW